MIITSSSIHRQLMLAIAKQQLIVSPETSVMAAIAMMGEMGASCVIISGSEGRELMGLFTERDLIRICNQSVPLAQLTMQAVISHPVITIQETVLNNINDVLMLFQTHQVRHLPVLNGDRVMGVLTKDVLTEILAQTALNFDLNSSDREQAELSLQKSEQRYRALMDGASDAILLADTKGNLIEINKKGEELLGYSRDELKRLNISQIHPPEVLEAARNHFQSIVQQDLEVRLETLVISKNGRQTPVEIIGNLINLGNRSRG
ncbi:MAG: PAS domain S-box protein [Pseudanabaena sp. CAN_BIN31]|nr:PAS domain S-box protein [Pseudanabaena sp. CAN_BIN31]